MKRPLVVKPVAGSRGMSLVGLSVREVPAQSNSPAVPSGVLSGLGIDKLALARNECCWLRCPVK